MTSHHTTIHRYWASADARDWETFASVLAPEIRYDLPQTRERIHGRDSYLQFNREYPGDWRLTVDQVLVDGERAVSRTSFSVAGETQQAVTFFEFDDAGLVTSVTDFWPETYEPPSGREHLVERY